MTVSWEDAEHSLPERGFARLGQLLTPDDCAALIRLYSEPALFRSRIDMQQYRFGRGEYQYFRYPLPPLVEKLRHELYAGLAPIANQWAESLGETARFPPALDTILARCHREGQQRPTPLMLRYGAGDYNCLHQDLYGAIAFPFQVVCFLSEPGRDYTGGEFLLVENPPRAQSMGRALLPQQGEAVAITTRHRPVAGKRGHYRVAVRHGVSEVTSGERWTLGIIFHDAE
jgi:hypothetical protein